MPASATSSVSVPSARSSPTAATVRTAVDVRADDGQLGPQRPQGPVGAVVRGGGVGPQCAQRALRRSGVLVGQGALEAASRHHAQHSGLLAVARTDQAP